MIAIADRLKGAVSKLARWVCMMLPTTPVAQARVRTHPSLARRVCIHGHSTRYQSRKPTGGYRTGCVSGTRTARTLWTRNRHAKDTPMGKAITNHLLLVLLVGFSCIGVGVATAAEPPRRLPRDNLLVYRGAGRQARRREDGRGLGEAPGRDRPRHGSRDGQAPRRREALPARREGRGGGRLRDATSAGSSPTPRSRARRVPAYLLIPKDVLEGQEEGAGGPLPARHRQRRRPRHRRRPGQAAEPRLRHANSPSAATSRWRRTTRCSPSISPT